MINAQEIRKRRAARKLTMEQAARRAGWTTENGVGHRQKWNDIESGRKRDVTADTLLAISKALRCSMIVLMIDEQQEQLWERKSNSASRASRRPSRRSTRNAGAL